MRDLEILERIVARDDVGEELEEPRLIPLPVAELAEQPSLGFRRRDVEHAIEGPVRALDCQIPVEDDEGLAHCIDDGICEWGLARWQRRRDQVDLSLRHDAHDARQDDAQNRDAGKSRIARRGNPYRAARFLCAEALGYAARIVAATSRSAPASG